MSEMTQDEIKYLNIDSEHYRGWCWDSPFKSLGNVIHWIYVFANLRIAESILVGENEVYLWGDKIADIEWDEEYKMPVFKWTLDFIEENEWIVDRQKLYRRMMKVNHSTLSQEFRERWAMNDDLRNMFEKPRTAKKI